MRAAKSGDILSTKRNETKRKSRLFYATVYTASTSAVGVLSVEKSKVYGANHVITSDIGIYDSMRTSHKPKPFPAHNIKRPLASAVRSSAVSLPYLTLGGVRGLLTHGHRYTAHQK